MRLDTKTCQHYLERQRDHVEASISEGYCPVHSTHFESKLKRHMEPDVDDDGNPAVIERGVGYCSTCEAVWLYGIDIKGGRLMLGAEFTASGTSGPMQCRMAFWYGVADDEEYDDEAEELQPQP